ncbi:hypothetical protein LMG22931_03239 [Paraburkholderia nemoris]|nr:hypothetical protein LMG22931_03239 [Paraburkholderia nemoris]
MDAKSVKLATSASKKHNAGRSHRELDLPSYGC